MLFLSDTESDNNVDKTDIGFYSTVSPECANSDHVDTETTEMFQKYRNKIGGWVAPYKVPTYYICDGEKWLSSQV